MTLRVLAVDLGAASARVAAIDLDRTPPSVEIVHRVPHAPVRHPDGSLRWDWPFLVREVTRGLERGLAAGPVASIGVDTWGVDYGLIGHDGQLVAAPWSYRDERTAGWESIVETAGADRLYRATGIQLMPINTIFQLAAHDRAELAAARRLLMLPELLVWELTGREFGERTSAGTSALVDVVTGRWDLELLDIVGVDANLLPTIEPAGTRAGMWRGVPVHLVGGHDTASAVAALATPRPGAAFIASGTWLLVGAERPAADTSEAARLANFSNEPGVLGGMRFLKNVMGFWLLEQCRTAWGDPPIEQLETEAETVPAAGPVVDARDHRFLAPSDMEREIRAAAGLPSSAGRAAVVRCILESIARSSASVVAELAAFGPPPTEVHLLGGGSRMPLLVRLLEAACGLPVVPGAVEATALGNGLVQGVALGRFRDLTEARSVLSASGASAV